MQAFSNAHSDFYVEKTVLSQITPASSINVNTFIINVNTII